MKILHVVSETKSPEFSYRVLPLISQLNKKNIDAKLICLDGKSSYESAQEVKRRDLLALVRQGHFNLIHTHDLISLTLCPWTSLLVAQKSVNTQYRFLPFRINRCSAALTSAFVFSSQSDRDRCIDLNSFIKNKASVIYPGVDLSSNPVNQDDAINLRKKLGLKTDSFVVGNFGNFIREEDQTTLLKAFRKVISKKFNAELVLRGAGPLETTLKQTAKEYQIDEHVRFCNDQLDRCSLLSICDAVVVSSFTDDVPQVALEAMALGRPLVLTKLGGRAELMIDGESGFLVPCGYPERIESVVLRLYANRSLISQVGQNAKKYVEKNLSLQLVADHYEGLYRGLIAKN